MAKPRPRARNERRARRARAAAAAAALLLPPASASAARVQQPARTAARRPPTAAAASTAATAATASAAAQAQVPRRSVHSHFAARRRTGRRLLRPPWLYLLGIQSISSIVTCSVVSLLACWISPEGGVSAVRIGSVHRVRPWHAVQADPTRRRARARHRDHLLPPPAVVRHLPARPHCRAHTCTSDTEVVPSWRRVVFSRDPGDGRLRILARSRAAGHRRAVSVLRRRTACCGDRAAPAVALLGPLCAPASLFEAFDRVVRALAFALLYTTTVYCSAPTRVQSRATSRRW